MTEEREWGFAFFAIYFASFALLKRLSVGNVEDAKNDAEFAKQLHENNWEKR